jgi:hypothetical protein
LHEQDLDSISTRIHDGVPVEQLAERAADRRYTHTSFWVHFSKGTGRRFVSDEIEQQYFLNRAIPAAIWPRVGKPTA